MSYRLSCALYTFWFIESSWSYEIVPISKMIPLYRWQNWNSDRLRNLPRATWSRYWKWSKSHSVMPSSLWPHGLYSPWNSPGQNTGVGSLSLLQGIFPTQGWSPGLPDCRQFFTSWATGKRIGTGTKVQIYLWGQRPELKICMCGRVWRGICLQNMYCPSLCCFFDKVIMVNSYVHTS